MRSKTFSRPSPLLGAVHLLLAALVSAGISPAFARAATHDAGAAEGAKEMVVEDDGARADDANAFTFSAWHRLHGRAHLAAPLSALPALPNRDSTPPLTSLPPARSDFKGELARTLTRPAPPDPKALARHPFAPRPQSGSRKSKTGPVITLLAGLGMIGAGAYLVSSYKPPTTIDGLFDETSNNRRSWGLTLVSSGAVVTLGGLIWLARD
jgi:hypothetical protein